MIIPFYNRRTGETGKIEVADTATCSVHELAFPHAAITGLAVRNPLTRAIISYAGTVYLCERCLDDSSAEVSADRLADLKRKRVLA